MPHQYPAVEVQSTTFYLEGAPVRVPTVAAMEVLISTWADPRVPVGPPFTDQDPEDEEIHPRNTQLIPGKLCRPHHPPALSQSQVGLPRSSQGHQSG